MSALVIIMLLSSFFVSFVPRVAAIKNFAKEYKEKVIGDIEQSNREIMDNYDAN